MIDSGKLESFLKKVRSCRKCKTLPCAAAQQCTPFVYGKPTSNILVVSERPPPGEWKNNTGQMWERTLNISQKGTDVQSKLARWLDIVSVSEEKLFWIQRANCWVNGDRAYWDKVYTKCANKFLPLAIDLVKPKLIVTLGGMASGYFYDFTTLKKLMKRCLERGPKPDKSHHSYDVFPFYHPAGRAEKWRHASIDIHYKMEKLVRAKIRESDCLE